MSGSNDNPLWSGLAPNPLTAFNPPGIRPPANDLASLAGQPTVTPADAYDYNKPIVQQYLADTAQRLQDPRFYVDAAGQWSNAMLMGTTAPGFRAFHGSPYSFDRFDASKIGTGEGAQAYGRGLYVAGAEGTAQSYRDNLSPGASLKIGSTITPFSKLSESQQMALRTLNDYGGDYKAALDGMKSPESYDGVSPGTAAAWKSTIPHLEAWQKQGAVTVPSGHMYEVQVNADPAHFLDWDRPLSEQSPHVQEALGTFGIKPPSASFSVRPVEGGHVVDYVDSNGNPVTSTRVFKTPEEAQRIAQTTMQIMNRDPTGGQIYEHPNIVSGSFRDSAAAAAKLRDAGIPGIRYLDQGSRASGKGSYNSVIFDANTMEILRKYGIAGLMAGGGAAAATQVPEQ